VWFDITHESHIKYLSDKRELILMEEGEKVKGEREKGWSYLKSVDK